MITYLEGDATNPIGSGLKIIIHCVNNEGKWGAGFVTALSKRWEEPESAYRKLFDLNSEQFYKMLGAVQLVPVENDIIVANIFGQNGTRSPNNPTPINYDALACGIRAVGEYAWFHNATIHGPRLGCSLAGGSWEIVERILKKEIPEGRNVYIYDFQGSLFNP